MLKNIKTKWSKTNFSTNNSERYNKLEVGGRKSEVGSQRTEIRNWKFEDGNLIMIYKIRLYIKLLQRNYPKI